MESEAQANKREFVEVSGSLKRRKTQIYLLAVLLVLVVMLILFNVVPALYKNIENTRNANQPRVSDTSEDGDMSWLMGKWYCPENMKTDKYKSNIKLVRGIMDFSQDSDGAISVSYSSNVIYCDESKIKAAQGFKNSDPMRTHAFNSETVTFNEVEAGGAVQIRRFEDSWTWWKKVPSSAPFVQEKLKCSRQPPTNGFNCPGANADEVLQSFQEGQKAYKKKDFLKAFKIIKPWAMGGVALPQVYIGIMYKYGQGVDQDYTQAAEWLKQAAEQGHREGEWELGHLYEKGWGVPKDGVQAINWYRKSAENGYWKAQIVMGNAYSNGWIVKQDYKQSMDWYQKAAEQGSSQAQYHLGYFYEFGKGVSKDGVQAINWYRKSAEKGYGPAQMAMGNANSNGWVVPQDYDQAIYWYRKAVSAATNDEERNIATERLGTAEAAVKQVAGTAKEAPDDILFACHTLAKTKSGYDPSAQSGAGNQSLYEQSVDKCLIEEGYSSMFGME